MSQSSVGPDPLNSSTETLQPLRALRQWVVLGVVILALALLLLAFFLIRRSVQSDLARGEATLSALQEERLQLQTPLPAVQALMGTLTTTRALADQIQAAAPPIGINWPLIMAPFERYDPNRLLLTSLTQVDNHITLTGLAANEEVVVGYTQAIEESDRFASVVLQSLRIVAAPTATPPPTVALTPLPLTLLPPTPVGQPPFLSAGTTLADFVIIVELEQ